MQNFEIDTLPKTLPILPLHGAILLPRARIPIPISDLDYMLMMADALKTDKFIGVVQPLFNDKNNDKIDLFRSGCVGLITDVNEVDGNQFVVNVQGVCRFEITEEVEHQTYRQANVSYERYRHDLVGEVDFPLDRKRLVAALTVYFKSLDVTPNWQEIDQTSNEKLITALTMVCPFDPQEKQIILEAPDFREQSDLLTTVVEMAAFSNIHKSVTQH